MTAATAMTHRAPSARRRATAWIVLAAFVLAPPGLPAAFAAPEGEQVVHGRVDPFERDGDTTNIRTHSRRTIIRYTGFDILSHETVNIHQPDPGSRILNQVRSTDPTLVNGTLWSNGQVWIVNPVGVFVGDTAVVDVGGLVAAAGHVDHADFLGGVERFTDLQGTVEVAAGARIAAADSVLLLGRHVASYGNITARDGTIALVAGNAVRLARVGSRVVVNADPAAAPDPERFAVTQAGTADAGRGAVHLVAADDYSLAMNHTGITRAREIHAEGGDGGLVDVAGTLDATGEGAGDTGGTIHVLGERIALRDATLDASGDAGGGAIRVGGDLQGKGALRAARRTWVSEDAVLRADAGTEGDGGTIIVWADDATRFHGTLSARGGATGGDGGFAEISGRRSLVARGDVDLGAPRGASGTLLYDPEEIEIVGSEGGDLDGDDLDLEGEAPEVFLRGDDETLGEIGRDDAGEAAEGEPFRIYESEIEGTDANIVLQATRRVGVSGTFGDSDTGDTYAADVVLLPGNDLTIEVGVPADEVEEGDDPVFIEGIDLRDPEGGTLVWKTSEGGRVTLRTHAPDEQLTTDPGDGGGLPEIHVDAIRTSGVLENEQGDAIHAVEILADGSAAITVGEIVTSGSPREMLPDDPEADADGVAVVVERGGNVFISSEAGDIRIGRVEALGGSAQEGMPESLGDGGRGGNVEIGAVGGRLHVAGGIDTSGGDAYVGDATPGGTADAPETGGIAGAAGRIVLGTGGASNPLGSDLRLTVGDDLVARGGAGFGVATIPETGTSAAFDVGASGGAGGAILVDAGSSGDEGEAFVGYAVDPDDDDPLQPVAIQLDASGGSGTGGGGAGGGVTVFGAGGITTTPGSELLAVGGDAGVDAGPGGRGGAGGAVRLESAAGAVVLAEGPVPAIVTDGGTGRFDADTAAATRDFELASGGAAGSVTLAAQSQENGSVFAFGDIQARGGEGDNGNGGSGGTVTLTTVDGLVMVSDVDATGGTATGFLPGDEEDGVDPLAAQGGNGGGVTIQARTLPDADGGAPGEPWRIALLGDLDTQAGEGFEELSARAGQGGVVSLTTEGTVGSGDATDTDGSTKRVLASRIAIDADRVEAGTSGAALELGSAGRVGTDGDRTVDVTLRGDGTSSFQLSGQYGAGDGAADDERFDRVSIVQAEATGAVDVTGGDGDTIAIAADDDGIDAGDDTRHRLTALRSGDADPHLTYRLLEGTLVVATGAGQVGAAGAKLANARREGDREVMLGDIEGEGGGSHLATSGNLELVARRIGTGAQAFVVAGAAPDADAGLELTVAGDANLDAAGGGVGRVDVQQRETRGNVSVALSGGDGVTVEGDVCRDCADGKDIESMRVTAFDTDDSAVAFFYSLEDGDDGTGAPPAVVVESGAVTLGAEAGVAGTGDLLLQNEGGQPTVTANGHTLALLADADFDGSGEIRATTPDALAIDGAGALVLLSGEGVGEVADAEAGTADAPLRVRGQGTEVAVAGSGGSGDFHLANESGTLRLETVALEELLNDGTDERSSFAGLHADGDVVLDNGGRTIVLGAIQPDEEIQRFRAARGLGVQGEPVTGALRVGFGGIAVSNALLQGSGTTTEPHVTSGGSQTYAGPVLLENARTFETREIDEETELPVVEKVHEVLLEAGGDVVFEGSVDTSEDARAVFTPGELEDGEPDPRTPIDAFLAGSLEVDADGTTVFRGDVGTAAHADPEADGRLGALVTNAARFEGDRLVEVQRADFRGVLDGDGALAIRAEAPAPDGEEDEVAPSRVTFRGDVGAGEAFTGLDVDADEIRFASTDGGRADRVVTGAGGIRLNTATPRDADDVPSTATIADTSGGLSLESAGEVAVGPREKLSVVGPLAIRAGGSVAVGDLSAGSIRIAAPSIQVLGRQADFVRLPDGSLRMDRGVDWVANEISTNVTPEWDGTGARPTFALGSGGIDVAGPLPFEVIRFRGGGGDVSAASFLGPDGAILDLTGTGERVLADPTDDLPRPLPAVAPTPAPRFGEGEPSPAPRVTGEQVLAYLACRPPPGESVCDAEAAREALDLPAFADTALGTERARGIAAETRALVRGPDARARLVAAFAPVERAWRGISGPGPVQGEALYRLLAAEPALSEARGQVDRLAALLAQVSLLGLPTEDTGRVQEALAADFAEATGMAGLDARAVLTAAGTSPVGQIPDRRAR